MLRRSILFSPVVVAIAATCISGCGTPAQNTQPPPSAVDSDDHTHKGDDHGDHRHEGEDKEAHEHGEHEHGDHAHGDADPAEIEEALAKLSSEDRVLAEKQKICPVTEDPLGAMGMPIKLDVSGNTVFICCDHCEEKLRADPEKYLGKMRK